MNACDIIAASLAPYWLPAGEKTGDAATDAQRAIARRYRKADGAKATQFNTGGLLFRSGSMIAFTECAPAVVPGPEVSIRPTQGVRNALIADFRANGPPLLVVEFSKGANDPKRWICSTADEVVFNGPEGPEARVLMEDVRFIAALPGDQGAWKKRAGEYGRVEVDPRLAQRFFEDVEAFAGSLAIDVDTVMANLHRLRRCPGLAFRLAEKEG
jgi:hypothetical protein